MKEIFKTRYCTANLLYYLTIPLMVIGCTSLTTTHSTSDHSSDHLFSNQTKQTEDTSIHIQQKIELIKMYSQAIGDYIRLVNKEYKLSFDTLFFGKHVYGQEDDFPDIDLPAIIEQTNIRLISPDQGMKKQKDNKSSFYINLFAWVQANQSTFNFVSFSNGMAHQFDAFIKYKSGKKGFELENTRLELFGFKAN